MAISGDLNDFSMIDVLRTIRSKTGTLYLFSALGGRSVEMALHQNHVLSMFIDGFPIEDKGRASSVFRQILNDSHGRFSFQDEALETLNRHYLLPVFPLVSQTQFEREATEAELPHPQTRFRALNTPGAVPSVLAEAWRQTQPLMQVALSGEELAERLNIPLRDALITIYRLRSAGLIGLAYTEHSLGVQMGASVHQSPSDKVSAWPTPASAAPESAGAAARSASGAPGRGLTTETRTVLQRLLQRLRGREVI